MISMTGNSSWLVVELEFGWEQLLALFSLPVESEESGDAGDSTSFYDEVIISVLYLLLVFRS